MYDSTNGQFEVKEQSLYRALRRFSDMGLVTITEEESPNAGPKRKYFELTAIGRQVLGEFVRLNISPLLKPATLQLITSLNGRKDTI